MTLELTCGRCGKTGHGAAQCYRIREGTMKYIRAILYWVYPQQGCIDALKRKIKAQEALIQTIKASRQSDCNENAKLWAELKKLRGE